MIDSITTSPAENLAGKEMIGIGEKMESNCTFLPHHDRQTNEKRKQIFRLRLDGLDSRFVVDKKHF